jgi:N-dimethylarginine dimethylaminohydrolase
MTSGYGGQSMVGRLRAVLPPGPAGWDRPADRGRWRALGFLRPPDAGAAAAQHDALRAELERAGAEVVVIPPPVESSLDAVYVHDPSLLTDAGGVCLRMGKLDRRAEPAAHAAFYASSGIPVVGRVEPPGTVEAGDAVWLDARTLLVGRGYRSNAAGIEQLRRLLAPLDVEVVEAPLPHGRGPGVCLHLMSILSLLAPRCLLVDLPWLAVSTVEEIQRRGFEWIEIDPDERDTLACNVLALGGGRLLALAENPRTNTRLSDAGFDVRVFPGSEIGINGGGGPTCLTRPLLRDRD